MRLKSQNSILTISNLYLITSYLLILLLTSCTSIQFTNNSPNPEVQRSYFPNGNIEYEAIYINGKLDGISRVWLEDGSLFSESGYSNGHPHGIWKKYHPNGKTMYETIYEYGKINGSEKWFYKTGQIKSEQYFLNGNPTTKIARWKLDGSLLY